MNKFLNFLFGAILIIAFNSIVLRPLLNKEGSLTSTEKAEGATFNESTEIVQPTEVLEKRDTQQSLVFTQINPELEALMKERDKRQALVEEGYSLKENQKNGNLGSCYNYVSRKGNLANYLKVSVGVSTDVAVKVMNEVTDVCVRYVYIRGGSTYFIRNIPEGRYYLKIAYGQEWYIKNNNGNCEGKFFKNPLYEKGSNVLDFYQQKTYQGVSTSSYSLHLDVVTSDPFNSFHSTGIGEEEFNL